MKQTTCTIPVTQYLDSIFLENIHEIDVEPDVDTDVDDIVNDINKMPYSIAHNPFSGPAIKQNVQQQKKEEKKERGQPFETGAASESESDDDEELTSCSESSSNGTDSDSDSDSDQESESSSDKNEGLDEEALDYQNSAYYAYAQAEYVCNSGSMPNNSVASPNSIPSPAHNQMAMNMNNMIVQHQQHIHGHPQM